MLLILYYAYTSVVNSKRLLYAATAAIVERTTGIARYDKIQWRTHFKSIRFMAIFIVEIKPGKSACLKEITLEISMGSFFQW